MLGFYPISTLPISTLPAAVSPSPAVTTGADSGPGRTLTRHERKRRRVHQQQMGEWRREFESLLADDPPPQVRAVASTIVQGIERTEAAGDLARRSFVQFFPLDATLQQAIILPSDRGEIAREVQQRRQIADIAMRLRAAIQQARAEQDEEDDVIALLLMS